MKARLEAEDAKALYKLRKQTVEPVFGIIKSAIGFTRFRLRGLRKAATEWTLITLAYTCRRIRRRPSMLMRTPACVSKAVTRGLVNWPP